MDDDYPIAQTESLSLSPGTAWGLAALLVGCSLLISACELMVFNVTLFNIGLRGVNKEFAQAGGVIGAASVALLGVCSTWWGYRGWSAAVHKGESSALGVAGTVTSVIGLVAWLIAAIDMLAVLNVIPG